jgi:hypothetical protein
MMIIKLIYPDAQRVAFIAARVAPYRCGHNPRGIGAFPGL